MEGRSSSGGRPFCIQDPPVICIVEGIPGHPMRMQSPLKISIAAFCATLFALGCAPEKPPELASAAFIRLDLDRFAPERLARFYIGSYMGEEGGVRQPRRNHRHDQAGGWVLGFRNL